MTEWTGRRVLVIGARTGMGAAISDRFSRDGANVVRGDLPSVGWPAEDDCVGIDVTDERSVDSGVREAADRLGGLDAVIDCAGILGPVAPLTEMSVTDFDRVLAVNLRGAFLVARAAVPILLDQPRSRLVFIASIAGKEGNPGMAAYSASKAGLIGLVKALAKEHAGDGLTVNAIAPAIIETPLIEAMTPERRAAQKSLIPMARFGSSEEAAALVEYIVSDEAAFTTGFVYDLSGGRATY